MSLLSTIRNGLNTFNTAVAKIEAGAAALYSKVPAFMRPTVDALVVDAKQAASNAVMQADQIQGPLITVAADTLSGVLRTQVAKYVGDKLSGELTAPVIDGIHSIGNALSGEIHTEILYILSELAQGRPVPAAGDQSVKSVAGVQGGTILSGTSAANSGG